MNWSTGHAGPVEVGGFEPLAIQVDNLAANARETDRPRPRPKSSELPGGPDGHDTAWLEDPDGYRIEFVDVAAVIHTVSRSDFPTTREEPPTHERPRPNHDYAGLVADLLAEGGRMPLRPPDRPSRARVAVDTGMTERTRRWPT
jgi:hypothetical protein